MYKLISHNIIDIGGNIVKFHNEIIIKDIRLIKGVICFLIWPQEADIDWNDPESHIIWKRRVEKIQVSCLGIP
jgi:hypothetical protein